VSARRLRDRIIRRAKAVALDLEPSRVDGLESYFLELARWNRKINLTAFQMDADGTDEAVDRLLLEPVLAARHIPAQARTLLDIGSGGGSPAVPMKLARPDLTLTMVEVKVRKSVFLRQIARHLNLTDTHVENARFEELLTRPALHENVDVMSIRAVRLDTPTLLNLQAFLKPGGQLLNFSAGTEPPSPPPPLRLQAVHSLISDNQSRLVVIQKTKIGWRST